MMRKSIDTVDICIKLKISIFKLTYLIVLSGFFFQGRKYSRKAKKHYKTSMKSQFHGQFFGNQNVKYVAFHR